MNTLTFVLVSIILLPLATLCGQVAPGLKLGINESTISRTRLDSKRGLYIGGYMDIPISTRYTIQPEVLYSSQGGTSKSSDYNDVQIHYLSIMGANKFYVMDNKGFHFNVGLGLDVNLKNNFVNLFNGNGDSEISPFDVAIYGGIGYEFEFGLTLEARYKQGTVSVDFLGANNLYEEDGTNLNGVLQVGAAYKFKLK